MQKFGNNRFKAESKLADWLLLTSPKSLRKRMPYVNFFLILFSMLPTLLSIFA